MFINNSFIQVSNKNLHDPIMENSSQSYCTFITDEKEQLNELNKKMEAYNEREIKINGQVHISLNPNGDLV